MPRRVHRNIQITRKRDIERSETGNNLCLLWIQSQLCTYLQVRYEETHLIMMTYCFWRFLIDQLKNMAIVCKMPVCNNFRTDKPIRIKRHTGEFCYTLLTCFDIEENRTKVKGQFYLDDLHALWCASPLYIAKHLSKGRSVKVIRGRTKFNTVHVYTRFPLVLRVFTWFNPKGLTPWICNALPQRNKVRHSTYKNY
jgi:hypothetical protein